MDFTKPVNEAALKRKRHWGKRLLVGGLCTVVLLAGVVALAPWVLSRAWARTLLLARVNAAIAPATLEVSSWHLAWFGEQEALGIRATLPDQGATLTLRRLRTNALWALLPLGHVEADLLLEAPAVQLTQPPLKPVPPPSEPAAAAGARAGSAGRAVVLPAWALSAKVRVTEASLSVQGLAAPLVQGAELTAELPALDAPLTLDFAGEVLGARSILHLLTQPLPRCLEQPAAALAQSTLSCSAPWGEAAAAFTATAAPLPEVKAKVRLLLPELLARLSEVSAALGRPMVLPEGFALTGGSLEAETALTPTANASEIAVALNLRTEALAGRLAGKPIALSPQITLRGALLPERPLESRLETFTLALPGLQASGSGSLAQGELALQAQSDALLPLLQPFVTLPNLAEPLALGLTLSGSRTQLQGTLDLQRKRAQAAETPLLKASLRVEEPDFAAQRFKAAALELSADLAQALTLAPILGEGQEAAGAFTLHATAAGGVENLRAKAIACLQQAYLRSAAWQIEAPELLRAEAELAYTPAQLAAEAFSLTLPGFTAEGSAALAAGAAAPTFALKGTCTPGVLLACRKPRKGEAAPPQLSGALNYTLRSLPGSQTLGADLTLASADLALTLPEQPPLALPFTLSAQAQWEAGTLQLTRCALAQTLLSLEAKGRFEHAGQRLTLAGTLTPDFAALWALPFCTPYRALGLEISGRHTTPFRLETPLAAGLIGLCNEGRAEASLRFDRVIFPGLDIPGGEAKLNLAEGVAALDSRFSVNGGTFTLSPRLNLSASPYILTLPDNSEILSEVQLTQALLDTALRAVNPLLPGSAEPKGAFSLRADRLRLPLGSAQPPLAALEAQLTMQTHGVTLQPNGTLGSILLLLQARERVLTLPDQHFGITVAEGRLICDELRCRIAAAHLCCSGSTNLLTRELNYTLTLPLTEQLLGRKLAKRIRVGETLRLPILGTLDKPKVDTSPILGLLRNNVLTRTSEKVAGHLGKALQRTGEAGLELGGAAGDVVEEAAKALSNGAGEGGDALGQALEQLFRRKPKQPTP